MGARPLWAAGLDPPQAPERPLLTVVRPVEILLVEWMGFQGLTPLAIIN